MKKAVSIVLICCLMFSLSACGGGGTESRAEEPAATVQESQSVDSESMSAQPETLVPETEPEQESISESVTESAEEDVENVAWDTLESLGNIETENGFLTVSITIPADVVGEDITQETLDVEAGENYVSAKLNEDGSVTYKLTKKQHKAMMEGIVASMEESLQGMVDSEDYSFTEITHNGDYTQFDISVSGEELGFADSFAVLAFYMYGGLYGVFTGKTPEKVIVNFYNPNGDLISTADSSTMES